VAKAGGGLRLSAYRATRPSVTGRQSSSRKNGSQPRLLDILKDALDGRLNRLSKRVCSEPRQILPRLEDFDEVMSVAPLPMISGRIIIPLPSIRPIPDFE
jgi:hypothetical protein